jgi:hypothetical protein
MDAAAPDLEDEEPVYLVCNPLLPGLAEGRVPAAPSSVDRCTACRAYVWLARTTAETVARRGLTARARVLCVPCAKPLMPTITGVIAADDHDPALAAVAAAQLGVVAGTPVLGGAGVPRA